MIPAGPSLESTVADRREGSGPLFLDQNEARKAENFILDRPPISRSGVPPPRHPLPEGLGPP